MPLRILSGFIVCFWIFMTFLLVRLEVDPDKSNLLTVPPTHVFKLMFTHEQVSELDIREKNMTIGNLTLHPKTDAVQGIRTLDFSGGISLLLPGATKKQRITWTGTLETDRAFVTRSMDLICTFHEPAYRVHFVLNAKEKKVDYEVKQGEHVTTKSSFTTDMDGLCGLLRDEFGIDPTMVRNYHSSFGAPTLTAKQTELKIRNENVLSYLLSFKQGGTMLAEIHVSQLGQVLAAKTLLGYTLAAEDTMPPP